MNFIPHWTHIKPKSDGYYWYIGPVYSDEMHGYRKPSDEPRLAHVFAFSVYSWGSPLVKFYGSTVDRRLKEIPDDAWWHGPIKVPEKP